MTDSPAKCASVSGLVGSFGLGLVLTAVMARPGLAQSGPGPAVGNPYADETARFLHEAAMDERARMDDAVVEYTAVVRQRVGAALRMPLKDRTLYRAESSHRVHWTRDGETLVQVLALREQTPLGVNEGATHGGFFDTPFDPVNDRLLFGFVDPDEDMAEPDPDDFWFEHPLVPEYRDSYTFSAGDTLTLSLPDGRQIQAIELRVIPVEADVHRMAGSLWIEPESGALVRAVYRLSDTFDAFRDIGDLREEEDEDLKFVPGMFKPWTFELSMIAVDYTLWDFQLWLPRSMRAEGVATAGILKAPASVDLSYDMESVITEADLQDGTVEEPLYRGTRGEAMAFLDEHAAALDVPYRLERGWTRRETHRGRRTIRYLVPEDPEYLLTSPELPPPVWDDAPGFASQAELERLFTGLADLPEAPVQGLPRTFRWGLQSPDLVRYNRVESASVGARGQIRPQTPFGPMTMSLEARLGAGDLEPNARLEFSRETLTRHVAVRGYHELAAVDESARHLGLGNSLMAVLFGRDDGEYYRRSGAEIEVRPPSSARATVRFVGFAEYHQAVETATSFDLWHIGSDTWGFRPNLVADEGWEMGGQLSLSPWWGTDPRMAQGGLDATVRAATGDFEYVRTSLTARLAVPLPSDMRVGLEAGGGTIFGDPPLQRVWLLGGAGSLRGYPPRSTEGLSYLRTRGELAKAFSFGAVAGFTDLGWAGDSDRFDLDDALLSIGLGLSLVDGLIRLDAGWGLRAPEGFRLDLYLDAIL